jgi:DNA-binding response OmpR family regulator
MMNGDGPVPSLPIVPSAITPDLCSVAPIPSRRATILLIEDDAMLAEMLRDRLASRGHTVWHAVSGAEAEAIADAIQPGLVIVDLVLPDANGLVLCANLRGRWTVPIIICTASTRPDDAVLGFKLGADDFVRKPFSTDELEARIEAALRRPVLETASMPIHRDVQRIGPLELDRGRCHATLGRETVHLTPIEFRLLCALADPPNQVHEAKALAERVWGSYDLGIGRSLQVHVRRMRAKLNAAQVKPPTLVAARGFGYRLIWEAEGMDTLSGDP